MHAQIVHRTPPRKSVAVDAREQQQADAERTIADLRQQLAEMAAEHDRQIKLQHEEYSQHAEAMQEMVRSHVLGTVCTLFFKNSLMRPLPDEPITIFGRSSTR